MTGKKIVLDSAQVTAAWQKYIIPAILKQSPEDFKPEQKKEASRPDLL